MLACNPIPRGSEFIREGAGTDNTYLGYSNKFPRMEWSATPGRLRR